MRRDDLCDPSVCPDAIEHEDGTIERCPECRLNLLDACTATDAGQLLRRALDLRFALNLGVPIGLDDILADEFAAMQVVEEERDRFDREQSKRA